MVLLSLLSLFSLFGSTPAQAGTFKPDLSLGVLQYAAETNPSSRVDFNVEWKSHEQSPSSEIKIYSFFETGNDGDRSIDLDTAVLRVPTKEGALDGHFWLGRAHPVSGQVSSTSAIGASWVQNQSNALEPRVSGWVGAGLYEKISNTGLSFTLAATPFYLPSFGSRLEFSETDSPSGSRFARLPPLYLNNNGTLLPLRYRIDTGDIKDIVLQEQYFVGLGYENSAGEFHLMAWTSPAINPQIDTEGILRPNPDVDVLVTAKPKFPREKYLAARWALSKQWPYVVAETTHELSSGRLVWSAEARPFRFLRAGYLNTIQTREVSRDPDAPQVESPIYGDRLAWIEVGSAYYRNKLRPSFRLEQNFTEGKKGSWMHPLIRYSAAERLDLFASASVITGEDHSYFGAWRSLDSVSTGVHYRW